MQANWLSLSFALFLVLAVTDLVYRYLYSRGYDPISLIVWSSAIGLACALMYQQKIKVPRSPVEILAVVSIGLLFFLGFYLLRKAQSISPNLALVNAVGYSSVALTLLLTALLFKDPLTTRMLLGIACILGGITLISLR